MKVSLLRFFAEQSCNSGGRIKVHIIILLNTLTWLYNNEVEYMPSNLGLIPAKSCNIYWNVAYLVTVVFTYFRSFNDLLLN